jgi:hypothetical protein
MTECDDNALRRDVAGHDARNVALLASIRSAGVSLEAARTVDIFFWASSRESARLVVEKLMRRGFLDIVTTPPADGQEGERWSVEGHLYETPQRVAATEFTKDMVMLAAASQGASYDGWGTRLHEAARAPRQQGMRKWWEVWKRR